MVVEKIKLEIEQIKGQRHQLLIIQENQENKLEILQGLKQLSIPVINLSLMLAKHLKDSPAKKRPRAVGQVLHNILGTYSDEMICLEKIEYLFDPELKQDPLRLLEGVSGNKVILLFWPGDVKDNRLTYANPGHPEFYEKVGYAQHIIQL